MQTNEESEVRLKKLHEGAAVVDCESAKQLQWGKPKLVQLQN